MERFQEWLNELDWFLSAHGRWPRKIEAPGLYQWASANNKTAEIRSRRAALLLRALPVDGTVR